MAKFGSDVGIIKIDRIGYIHRWCESERSHIDERLPESPGWLPEAYVSMMVHNEDLIGECLPHEVTHNDGNITNNSPENLSIGNPYYNRPIKQPGPLSSEWVQHGFFGDQYKCITRISRCATCGMPLNKQEGGNCLVCCDTGGITLLTNPRNHWILNAYIDFARGYDIHSIKIKYPLIDPLLFQFMWDKHSRSVWECENGYKDALGVRS